MKDCCSENNFILKIDWSDLTSENNPNYNNSKQVFDNIFNCNNGLNSFTGTFIDENNSIGLAVSINESPNADVLFIKAISIDTSFA
ncbi:MAG: hypothetical protein VXW36_06510, partial [Candidatus Thermoplasmatota archaeon]|nr:hypothetical protein [Candidatus Thermoplasmatota archaeon]